MFQSLKYELLSVCSLNLAQIEEMQVLMDCFYSIVSTRVYYHDPGANEPWHWRTSITSSFKYFNYSYSTSLGYITEPRLVRKIKSLNRKTRSTTKKQCRKSRFLNVHFTASSDLLSPMNGTWNLFIISRIFTKLVLKSNVYLARTTK